jgi:outer membrane lipoprotein-sorting protein
MRRRGVLLALVEVLAIGAAARDGAGATAREILDKAKALDETTRNWTDRTQRMQLTIHDAAGGERRRDLQVYAKRYTKGEEKAISYFLAPQEVKGIAFLQWTHAGRDDEQWLYLPEFKRSRQIAARLRDESFMGTDFSYRDLEIIVEFLRWSDAEAPAQLAGQETLGGKATDIIDLRPRLEGMPYRRIMLWMDRDQLVPRKLDFYDSAGALAKSLTLDDIRDVGAIPTAHRLEMRSVEKGSRTVVELPQVTYNSGLPDELFTQRYLDRQPGPGELHAE